MRSRAQGRRTFETRSAAAGRAASQPQARQRRRAQRSRRFAQQWSRVSSAAVGWIHLPDIRLIRARPQLRLPGFGGFHLSKIISLALLAGVVTLCAWFYDDDSFFVYQENVAFQGVTYLHPEELYALTDVEAWSVLWLEPEQIRRQILVHEYVADAQVVVQWPARIQVAVTEVAPVALWSTEGADFWVLADGRALPVREGGITPGLRLVDPQAEARAPGRTRRVPVELLNTALRLQQEVGLDEFWYNSSTGLNFGLPGSSTWIYWGDGTAFDAKTQALHAAGPEIRENQDVARTLSLISPNRPYFRAYPSRP